VQAAAMGLGSTWYSVLVPFMATVAFYLSTWEEYYTGVLYLGYINGPTEGLVMACLFMILSGVYGNQATNIFSHFILYNYYICYIYL
jgi:ethanolaminephosphotransferase